jgi:four helix bundle protein
MTMLRIYETAIGLARALGPTIGQIEAHDRDLARQLRRALGSVALNIAEGSGSRAGTRRERYQNALGSALETTACLDVASSLGYVTRLEEGVRDRLDFICGTLVKNVR